MSFCKDCGKPHKGKKEEYVEEKEVVREPFPYDPAPSEDKKTNVKCSECGKLRKDMTQFRNANNLIHLIGQSGFSAFMEERGPQGVAVKSPLPDEMANRLKNYPSVRRAYKQGAYWYFEIK